MTALPVHERLDDGQYIVAASDAMQEALRSASRFGRKGCNTLITGESGVGKEVVAREIHRARAAPGPFLDLNCAAVPESLFEGLMFGWRRGTFTGAVRSGVGLIEEAAGGVLFLDELSSMPVHLQAKLLRAIEQKAVRRLGDSVRRQAVVQYVVAVQGNAEIAIQKRQLREDLYYRTSVGRIHIPPLRERPADLLAVARQEAERQQVSLTGCAERLLLRLPWPGNVRELLAIIERAASLAEDPVISETVLRVALRTSVGSAAVSKEAQELIELARDLGRDTAKMASALNVDRSTVYRRLRRHGLTHLLRPGAWEIGAN